MSKLQEVKAIIKSLVVSNPMPEEMTVHTLNLEYHDSVGQFIPYRSLDFVSVEAFLKSIPDSVRVVGNGLNAKVYNVTNEKTIHISRLVQGQKPKVDRRRYGALSRGIRSQRQSAIHWHSPSIHCGVDHAPSNLTGILHSTRQEYTSANTHPLPIKGFKKLVTFEETSKEQQGTTGEDSSTASGEDDLLDENAAVPLMAIDSTVLSIDSPLDTVPRGWKIPPYKLPIDVKVSSRVSVYVSQVHNPYKFWFHFHKEDHELDVLVLEMEHFYGGLSENYYCIPECLVLPGQICAAYYEGEWCRAEVLSEVHNSLTKVYYVDYGTVAELDICFIKYLKRCFVNLPMQAMRGCLSHVKPATLHWSYEAIEAFISIARGARLHALISDIDEAERVFYMVQCHDDGEKVTQINTKLIEEGWALLDKSWPPEITQNYQSQRKPDCREKYPTFEMIETNEYPSLSEIVQLRQRGVHYDCITLDPLFHPSRLNPSEPPMDLLLRKLVYPLLCTNPFFNDILDALQQDDTTYKNM